MKQITRQRRTESMMYETMSMCAEMMCRNMVTFGVRFLPALPRSLCSHQT